MSFVQRYYLWAARWSALVLTAPLSLYAADPAAPAHIITLQDGRQLSGEIDIRSDQELLWLRRFAQGIELLSGFRWAEIRHVQTPSGIQSASEIRDDLETVVSAGPTFDNPVLNSKQTDRVESSGSTATSRLATLLVEAEVAQWNSDAQPDGLIVTVLPLDDHGRVMRIRGNIELTLFGMIGPHVPVQTHRVLELERVTHVVRTEHFQDGPAVYRVPFTKFAPDLATDIGAVGLLHARLGANGQGAFEASDPEVCLRPCLEYRDHLQLYTGKRFLPFERGSGPHR